MQDATRTDKDFACKIINITIQAGATTINIPDTVGIMLPYEFSNFLNFIKMNSKINTVDMSVHCHNDLGLATANTLSAIINGANKVEVTVNGIGERAGNTSLEEIVTIINKIKLMNYKIDDYNISSIV